MTGITNWPRKGEREHNLRSPVTYLGIILLFPEGLNGLIAFTANGYIIPLLSLEIFSTVNLFYNYQ